MFSFDYGFINFTVTIVVVDTISYVFFVSPPFGFLGPGCKGLYSNFDLPATCFMALI